MQRKDPCRDLLLFVEFLLDIAEVFLLDDLGTLWAQQIDGKPHPVGVDIVIARQDAFIDQAHADIQDLCPGVALPQRAKGQILAFAADQAGFHGLPGGEQPRVPKIFDLLLFGI